MKLLMAKLKSKQEPYYRVLNLSKEQELYPPYKIEQAINYNPKYKLEDDECFKIDEFSKEAFCLDILKKEFNPIEYKTLNKIKDSKIEFVFLVQNNNFYFQRVTPSQIVERKFLSFKNNQIIDDGQGIVIKDEADAYYDKKSDILYFKNLNSIKGIFDGIQSLYREATDEEVEEFLNKGFIKLEGDYGLKSVGVLNRKRIGLILELINEMNKKEFGDILDYVCKYCGNLKFDNDENKFIISSDSDLKSLIFGIDQRYYTTEVGGEKRLANSVTKIS